MPRELNNVNQKIENSNTANKNVTIEAWSHLPIGSGFRGTSDRWTHGILTLDDKNAVMRDMSGVILFSIELSSIRKVSIQISVAWFITSKIPGVLGKGDYSITFTNPDEASIHFMFAPISYLIFYKQARRMAQQNAEEAHGLAKSLRDRGVKVSEHWDSFNPKTYLLWTIASIVLCYFVIWWANLAGK